MGGGKIVNEAVQFFVTCQLYIHLTEAILFLQFNVVTKVEVNGVVFHSRVVQ